MRYVKRTLVFLALILIIPYLLPNKVSSPVRAGEILKIDRESFWYYPWGESGVHKGIDIFCGAGTKVFSPVSGVVVSKGYGKTGGNFIYILGPEWRTYYFAHLDTIVVHAGSFVKRNAWIGIAGNTGNAIGRPTHVHFSIQTLLPYPWRYQKKEMEGWKKMFYLDPLNQVPLLDSAALN